MKLQTTNVFGYQVVTGARLSARTVHLSSGPSNVHGPEIQVPLWRPLLIYL